MGFPMTKRIALRSAFGILLLGLLGSPSLAQTSTENTVTGITKPSVHAKLGLNQLATVLELPVKEGQAVKKGDVLLQQDDRGERAALEGLEMEANSDVRIEASKADARVKQVQLKRYEELARTGNATASELEEAQVKAVYAEA